MRHRTTIAVDLAKTVFAVAISRRPGRVDQELRLSRAKLVEFLARQAPAVVVIEACGSAHYWARKMLKYGHTPVPLPPQYVRPYVRRNKTDAADARALLEAYRDQQLKPVAIKTVEQQALGSLHRLRAAWMKTRTARINALRGVLRELGVTIPVGAQHVLPRLATVLAADPCPVPPLLHPHLFALAGEIRELEQRVRTVERDLARATAQIPAVARFLTIPGVGILTATALFAFCGDLSRYTTGRHFASSLGLTPRESSSGQRRRLGSISHRGDAYLRTLLIHGARSVLHAAKRLEQPDRLRAWALRLEHSAGHNKAAVALANKLARIAWALDTRQREFAPVYLDQAA